MSFGTVQAEKMTTESGYSLGAGNASSFKNRLINGAMTVDQRNAGASITVNDQSFSVDRFKFNMQTNGKGTAQQSTDAPTGFKYSLLYTNGSAYTVGSSETYGILQVIEGYNIADLAWGTASAQSVTLSFWVKSSVTGTFGGALKGGSTYTYAFTYTINSANTWEQKTITVPGPAVGTWGYTNSAGLTLSIGLGNGSSASSTPNSWLSANTWSATGAVSVLATAGATFYITGVQLEVGTVATSFDFRSFGTELALCQRYYFAYAVPATCPQGFGAMQSTTAARIIFPNPVPMRATPTFTSLGSLGIASGGTSFIASASSVLGISSAGVQMDFTVSGATTHQTCVYRDSGGVTFSAEL